MAQFNEDQVRGTIEQNEKPTKTNQPIKQKEQIEKIEQTQQ